MKLVHLLLLGSLSSTSQAVTLSPSQQTFNQNFAQIDENLKIAKESKNKQESMKAAMNAKNEVAQLASNAIHSLSQVDEGQKYYEYQNPNTQYEIPNVQYEMNKLGGTLPALRGLESKLDMMRQLKPEIRSLANDINSITDTTDLARARQGGGAIKRMLTNQGRSIENDWARRTEQVWGDYAGSVISSSTRPYVADTELPVRYVNRIANRAPAVQRIVEQEPEVERVVVKEPEVERVVVKEPVVERVMEKEPVKVVEKVIQEEEPAETTKTKSHSTSQKKTSKKEDKEEKKEKKKEKTEEKEEKESSPSVEVSPLAVESATNAITKIMPKVTEIAKSNPEKAKHLLSVAKTAAISAAKAIY